MGRSSIGVANLFWYIRFSFCLFYFLLLQLRYFCFHGKCVAQFLSLLSKKEKKGKKKKKSSSRSFCRLNVCKRREWINNVAHRHPRENNGKNAVTMRCWWRPYYYHWFKWNTPARVQFYASYVRTLFLYFPTGSENVEFRSCAKSRTRKPISRIRGKRMPSRRIENYSFFVCLFASVHV